MSFDEFWSRYPKKVSKGAARKSYGKASAEDSVILAGLDRYLDHLDKERTEKQFIKMPATWLNQECWEDQYTRPLSKVLKEVSSGPNEAARGVQIYSTELLPAIMLRYKETGFTHWRYIKARMEQARKLADLRAAKEAGRDVPLDVAEQEYNTGKLPDDVRQRVEHQEIWDKHPNAKTIKFLAAGGYEILEEFGRTRGTLQPVSADLSGLGG